MMSRIWAWARSPLALWALGVVAIMLSGIDATLGVIVAAAWSVFTLWRPLRRSRHPKPLRAMYVLAAIITAFVAIRAYHWIIWNPVGSPYDSGWGWSPLGNVVENVSSTQNGQGVVAVVTRTVSGMLSDEDVRVPYFIFVRSTLQNNRASNLVFRYTATEQGWYDPPTVVWSSPSTLKIRVGDGDIWQVTKQAHNLNGVRVIYAIGVSREPAVTHFWQRPFL